MQLCSRDACDNEHVGKGLCRKHYMREYRNNVEQKAKEKEAWTKWHEKNRLYYKSKKKELRETQQYKERVRKYRKDRYHSDMDFKLRCILRTAFQRVLNGSDSYMLEKLGCSVEQLKKHLESQFQDGMSWENHGEWHIDHIIPLVKQEHIDNVYHYTNLQPLWAKDNLKKGSK